MSTNKNRGFISTLSSCFHERRLFSLRNLARNPRRAIAYFNKYPRFAIAQMKKLGESGDDDALALVGYALATPSAVAVLTDCKRPSAIIDIIAKLPPEWKTAVLGTQGAINALTKHDDDDASTRHERASIITAMISALPVNHQAGLLAASKTAEILVLNGCMTNEIFDLIERLPKAEQARVLGGDGGAVSAYLWAHRSSSLLKLIGSLPSEQQAAVLKNDGVVFRLALAGAASEVVGIVDALPIGQQALVLAAPNVEEILERHGMGSRLAEIRERLNARPSGRTAEGRAPSGP